MPRDPALSLKLGDKGVADAPEGLLRLVVDDVVGHRKEVRHTRFGARREWDRYAQPVARELEPAGGRQRPRQARRHSSNGRAPVFRSRSAGRATAAPAPARRSCPCRPASGHRRGSGWCLERQRALSTARARHNRARRRSSSARRPSAVWARGSGADRRRSRREPPLHLHGQACVARIEPIAVPALRRAHVDGQFDLAARRCRSFGDEPRLNPPRASNGGRTNKNRRISSQREHHHRATV